jgi:hypothetical protein
MTPILSFQPFVSTAKESPAYWLLDILRVVHATGEQTQGRHSIIEPVDAARGRAAAARTRVRGGGLLGHGGRK